MAPSLSTILDCCPELIHHILTYLELPDILAFSIVSRISRLTTLPALFGRKERPMRIVASPYHSEKQLTGQSVLSTIESASQSLKTSVRSVKIFLFSHESGFENRLFRCLTTLSNLECLVINIALSRKEASAVVAFCEKMHILNELQLFLDFASDSDCDAAAADDVAPTIPVLGPSGLTFLSVDWHIVGSFSGLVDFIKPSVYTLVSLKLVLVAHKNNGHHYACVPLLDLKFLAGAGSTLTPFTLDVFGFPDPDSKYHIDPAILESTCQLFPKLSTLIIVWSSSSVTSGLVWEDKHIETLSRLTNLEKLSLSFDFDRQDPYASNQSLSYEAAVKLAAMCPKLELFEWREKHVNRAEDDTRHSFLVHRRSDNSYVVKHAMQWWSINGDDSPLLPPTFSDDETSDAEEDENRH